MLPGDEAGRRKFLVDCDFIGLSLAHIDFLRSNLEPILLNLTNRDPSLESAKFERVKFGATFYVKKEGI